MTAQEGVAAGLQGGMNDSSKPVHNPIQVQNICHCRYVCVYVYIYGNIYIYIYIDVDI